MSNKDISVSVIITTYDRELNYLKNAVESVFKQTFEPSEIIIVDDNDNILLSRKIEMFCYSNDITYVHNLGSRGACSARNLGISIATSSYIAFLDDDDVWLPKKLELQVNIITEKTIMVYCNGWKIDKRIIPESCSEYRKSDSFNCNVTFEQLLERNHIGTTTQLLIKKSALYEINGFDEELPARQDYDLCLRLALHGELVGINNHLFIHYLHFENQISKSSISSLIAYKKLYKKFKTQFNTHKNAKTNILFKISRMERLQQHYIKSILYLFEGIICSPSKWKIGICEIQKSTTV